MLTQQVNSNGIVLGHQYQQSIRPSGDSTVGSSLQVQRGIDGGLQYDSASFPVLSGGGGGNNRFSGLPMPQQQQQQQNAREEDFTIQNEDFPALPGSHVDRNSQKHEINSMMGSMMSGGQIQAPQGSDRIRELSQENLQHHLLEQQQQQLQLQLQQQGSVQNQAQGSAVSRGSSSLPQQANALSIVESSAQGGNNSLANGSFLGIGVGGAIQGHLNSNGLGSTVGGTGVGVGVGGVGGVAGVSQSKEGGYGLAGLLDVIRMTDKVGREL